MKTAIQDFSYNKENVIIWLTIAKNILRISIVCNAIRYIFYLEVNVLHIYKTVGYTICRATVRSVILDSSTITINVVHKWSIVYYTTKVVAHSVNKAFDYMIISVDG